MSDKNNQGLLEPSDYTLITDNQSLNALCSRWENNDFLALDTEFIRTSTFYPKVGLIQVCDNHKNYLIDPLEIDDWDFFTALMIKPSLTKIFHSCSEDLLVFFAFLGVIPRPIFDTQIATAFLNEGFALSYQNMVKERVNIDIPKDETRSDWLQRPLTDEQLQYAALDVAYLPEIFNWQTQQLQASGKLGWLQEECERLIQQYQSEVNSDFNDYYLNIKAAWQLDSRQLGVLQKLASWREERARKRDKPRSWIIKDKQLVAVAKSFPESKQHLSLIPEISANFVNYEGSEVLEIVSQMKSVEEALLPE
ncbi:ribonuclease D, partial [Gammaproteobacteria bacterium]|nr:ribonuclease D [Gammaproteobacteria bacterium]